ncbi:alpha/beta hydrolase [Microlunatus panaciterrae]|uniref:Pimeloyl-ACP methyl ester carboxylesterase n=1 Tax=Microlunatus panaciterrae TaxID=400768 RepID=A0ABS2RP87_9ACTN|nr:pimeloyl-ACP methyl ester carboxylesterase [Microlunatus panaciterrae]
MATALTLATGSALLSAPTATALTGSAKTSKVEARRVDSVKTPRLGWYTCYSYAQCAIVKLPRDYDHPNGTKVEVALLRVKARDQRHKIGSLFVNPGGPGGSATELAYNAPSFLGSDILDRFDIVGMDPRGTNFSDQVACFPDAGKQATVLADLSIPFPVTSAEEHAFIRGSKRLGRACSSAGRPLSASMSTAEVARDMDVIRRAVGDRRLTYLGFSYGTYLGQVYANLFPDRVRALAIDGVVDPVAWAGTRSTRNRPETDRIRSADGATKALHEILVRCDRAGGTRCSFAPGNPVANFDLIARRLRSKPLVETDPFTGEVFRFGYAELVSSVLGMLYDPMGYAYISDMLSQLIIMTEPPAATAKAASVRKAAAKRRATATRRLVKILDRQRQQAKPRQIDPGRTLTSRFGFPYDNSLEAFTTVLCTDSVNPISAESWPAAADAADRRAKYFGRAWIWSSAPCARRTWTAGDEDGYHGPFNRATLGPVLVVGNLWDPATNFAGARKAAALLPNSRLLTSDSWGHTAYGTSACVTTAMESFLLKVRLPARGKRCVGDIQPFRDDTGNGSGSVQRLLRPVGRITPLGG